MQGCAASILRNRDLTIFAGGPLGAREVPDTEITTAIRKAFHATNPHTESKLDEQPKPQRLPAVCLDYLSKIISHGCWTAKATLRAKFPVKLPDSTEQYTSVLLSELYAADDESSFVENRRDK
jgi:hypothetical protein